MDDRAAAVAPDALGDAARAQMIVGMIADAQHKAFECQLVQISNEAGDDDPVAGDTPRADGKPWTYAERIKSYEQAAERMFAAYPDLKPRVLELLAPKE